MLRKILAVAGALALVAVIAPQSASAAEGGTIVFTGDAVVGSGAYNGAQGNGLCFPGLDPAASCQSNPGVVVPPNGWDFSVPANPNAPLVLCSATGTFGGTSVNGAPCEIVADGDAIANPIGVGPSCGMSGGNSRSVVNDRDNDGIGDDDDPIDNRKANNDPLRFTGEAPDTVTIGGNTGSISTGWITSAGGTLVISGNYNLGTGANNFVGVVQARPLQQGACASVPASSFFVVGVTVGGSA